MEKLIEILNWGKFMDIGRLSIVMSQFKVQQSVDISLAKIAMDTNKESASQITEILKKCSINTNLGRNLDIRV